MHSLQNKYSGKGSAKYWKGPYLRKNLNCLAIRHLVFYESSKVHHLFILITLIRTKQFIRFDSIRLYS